MKRLAVSVLLLALLGVASCGEDEPAPPAIPPWAKVAPEQIAEAKKHGVPVAFENDLGMRFVLIPAGTFLMGSPEDEEGRDEDESPQHEVTILRPFYLATTEATQAVWKAVMGESPSDAQGELLPVEGLSWEDCQKFVGRLNETVPGGGYRMPTEAEWEYACRAGTTTRYWSGDKEEDLRRVGWYFRNSGKDELPLEVEWDLFKVHGEWGCSTRAVRGKAANAFGLHDMHGNVSEHCKDTWHDSYDGAPTDGRAQANPDPGLVVGRGGSCYVPAECARAASRSYDHAGSRSHYGFGFRSARDVASSDRTASPLPDSSK